MFVYFVEVFHFHLIAGFKFWKSPRRKVFAVRKSVLKPKGKKKKHFESFSDSDDEVTSRIMLLKPLVTMFCVPNLKSMT